MDLVRWNLVRGRATGNHYRIVPSSPRLHLTEQVTLASIFQKPIHTVFRSGDRWRPLVRTGDQQAGSVSMPITSFGGEGADGSSEDVHRSELIRMDCT